MSTHEIAIFEDDGCKQRLTGVQPTTKERFRDVRHAINERNEREVTNDEVLDLLMDVWWHHDRQSEEVLHS